MNHGYDSHLADTLATLSHHTDSWKSEEPALESKYTPPSRAVWVHAHINKHHTYMHMVCDWFDQEHYS